MRVKTTHRFALGVIAVLATLGSAHAASLEASNWSVRTHLPPERFLVQSHRGAGELAPENTLEAFELGWSLGTVPEADFRTTKDGVIVAFHDANFRRTVKHLTPELEKKGVPDVTYAELLKLDVGAWKGDQFAGRKISTVGDIFERMRGHPARRLYMDIKQVDFKQLAEKVREHQVEEQVILSTPRHDEIREWKSLAPKSQTLLWMGGTQEQIAGKLDAVRKTGFEGITQIQLHVRLNTNAASAEPFNLERQFVRDTGAELRRHGITLQVFPWGVAEPEIYWKLMDLGVAAFATDHPKVTVKAVRDYYRQGKRADTAAVE